MYAKNLRVAPEADVATAKLVLQPRVDALNRGPVDVADRLRGDVHGRPRLRFHSLISLAPCRGGD